jgi:hypothetical protein
MLGFLRGFLRSAVAQSAHYSVKLVPDFERQLIKSLLTLAGWLASWLDVKGAPNADGVRKASHATKTIALTAVRSACLLLCHLISDDERV